MELDFHVEDKGSNVSADRSPCCSSVGVRLERPAPRVLRTMKETVNAQGRCVCCVIEDTGKRPGLVQRVSRSHMMALSEVMGRAGLSDFAAMAKAGFVADMSLRALHRSAMHGRSR